MTLLAQTRTDSTGATSPWARYHQQPGLDDGMRQSFLSISAGSVASPTGDTWWGRGPRGLISQTRRYPGGPPISGTWCTSAKHFGTARRDAAPRRNELDLLVSQERAGGLGVRRHRQRVGPL